MRNKRNAAGMVCLLAWLALSTTALAQEPVSPQHSDPVWQATYWNNTVLSGTPADTPPIPKDLAESGSISEPIPSGGGMNPGRDTEVINVRIRFRSIRSPFWRKCSNRIQLHLGTGAI